MVPIRGITVSVSQAYADLLAISLPRNMRHLTECLVVTEPGDPAVEVARSIPGVRVYETNSFTKHQALFNKGLCMEEGFDVLGRHGWILIFDADIVLPDSYDLPPLRTDTLYGVRRRCLADPSTYRDDLNWRACPAMLDGGPIGFHQLFHADAPALESRRPWYDVTFAHAGGGDAYFMDLFPRDKRRVLPIDVLHLGERDRSWFGTSPEAREVMKAFVVRNGWTRGRRDIDPRVIDRVGDFPERVQVPGYEPSDYDLPFTRRAKARMRNQAPKQ